MKRERGTWRNPTPEWGDRTAEVFALAVSICLFAIAARISIPAALIAYLAGWLWAGVKWVQRERGGK
jgi:hypothetical protein